MRRWTSKVAVLGLVVGFLMLPGAPAQAKGFMLTEMEITGPGLERPLVLDQTELSPRAGLPGTSAVLRSLFRGSIGTEPAFGLLGPRWRLTYRFEVVQADPVEVEQFLYPVSPDGPVVFTPRQEVAGPVGHNMVFAEDWETFPKGFLAALNERGLPAAADLRSKTVEPSGAPLDVRAALMPLLLALVLFGPRLRALYRFRPARV